jgi:hypothetical protein
MITRKRDNRIRDQRVIRQCHRCFGAGERLEVALEGMQVCLEVVPCRCREGVTN